MDWFVEQYIYKGDVKMEKVIISKNEEKNKIKRIRVVIMDNKM